jgi:ribonuclease G
VVKSPESLSVEIQRKLMAIMKARPRDDSDFQIRIHTHPSVLERMRSQDERLLIELEKRFYAKLTFRPEAGFHTEQWRIVNAMTNDELGKGDI